MSRGPHGKHNEAFRFSQKHIHVGRIKDVRKLNTVLKILPRPLTWTILHRDHDFHNFGKSIHTYYNHAHTFSAEFWVLKMMIILFLQFVPKDDGLWRGGVGHKFNFPFKLLQVNNPINLRSKQSLICQVLMMQEECETTHYILKKENWKEVLYRFE